MATTYAEALESIRTLAQERSASRENQLELVSLNQAVGRIMANDIYSPMTTPLFDTSAMDGFAVSSAATTGASEENPVIVHIKGTMIAGDVPITVSGEVRDGIVPCMEIMTGARFPETYDGPEFDACVPLEQTLDVPGRAANEYRRVVKPVIPSQHRRLAGSDFQRGELVVSARTILQPQHIMALASVCIAEVEVRRRVRVGIWSTGSELQSSGHGDPERDRIPDINGPYLDATLRNEGYDVAFFGTIGDEPDVFAKALRSRLASGGFDVFITTGAVSAGKFDFVRQVLEDVGSNIAFHKVAIRPGHPGMGTATTNLPSLQGLFSLGYLAIH
ncbi:hypothetical protein W97_01665 [Coniosporium apollinis CBS 100218]|uniref:molybdopterin adenylyltransferase n=1 Tax=Coniosporium apollinis (strain CBS 100218) TaxID=1168221 RepID=R7YKM8_CONA1|nr:uncharacterized protein W97_01665 [Coniosporium apollinis CBS 100218]EON62443.1 hypothetical protein W97_01665 [Coniosporium apollinis CBS 100218]